VTVVAVSTHLDDVVLSCFGALGPKATVVTVLAGVPPDGVLGGWDVETGATTSRARVLERRREDVEALRGTGSACVHLDFPDSQYWGLAGIAVPRPEELAEALRPLLADTGTVLAPAGIHNTDHKLVRDAALAVRPDATLYADLPYALHPDLGGFALPSELPDAGRQRRDLRLDPAMLAAKLDACRRYVTQLDRLAETFGPFLEGDALGLEVLWEPL
jgi:LmbE family N-acetylglucosaminyl deacetylase